MDVDSFLSGGGGAGGPIPAGLKAEDLGNIEDVSWLVA